MFENVAAKVQWPYSVMTVNANAKIFIVPTILNDVYILFTGGYSCRSGRAEDAEVDATENRRFGTHQRNNRFATVRFLVTSSTFKALLTPCDCDCKRNVAKEKF